MSSPDQPTPASSSSSPDQPTPASSSSSPRNNGVTLSSEEPVHVVPIDAILSTEDGADEQQELGDEVDGLDNSQVEYDEDFSSSSSSGLIKSPDPNLVSQQITQDIVSILVINKKNFTPQGKIRKNSFLSTPC